MLESIFKKLSFIEQNELRNYIKQEVTKNVALTEKELIRESQEREKTIVTRNNKSWDIVADNIVLSMRENKISAKRINKIFKRLTELTNANPDSRLTEIGQQPSQDFEILTKDEYRDLIIELLEGHCRGCKKHNKDCNVYKLLRKHEIPYSGNRAKCKYSY